MIRKLCISDLLIVIITLTLINNLNANDNNLPQRLNLEQFIDSTIVNHPEIKNSQIKIISATENSNNFSTVETNGIYLPEWKQVF